MIMGRREKGKESKFKIKIWLPILCIVVVGVTFYMIYDIQNKVDQLTEYEDSNEVQNSISSENVISKNQVQNEVIENEIANEINNETANVMINVTNTSKPVPNTNTNNNKPNTSFNPGVTDQKQKAIELVKKEWGNDDSVDFLFDYVNEKNEYVVAVKDKATATVKYYFRVNLETGTVELD